jgi:hypothetical protein
MDDEEETYRLWKIRKTIMQASSACRPCRANAIWGAYCGVLVRPAGA